MKHTQYFRKAVILLGLWAMLMTLVGCHGHLVDGPGMINKRTWMKLDVSSSSSYAQDNFWFTVEENENGFLLTGSCFGREGGQYESYEGVYLNSFTMNALWDMELMALPDVQPTEPSDVEGEAEMLDGSSSSLALTALDGKTYKKVPTSDVTAALYDLLEPHLVKAAD